MSKFYELSHILDAFSTLKKEKWIEKILKSVKNKIFWDHINSENIEEFKEFVRDFNSLYYLMKKKFENKYRTSWERYFEHLREVVNQVLKLPNPNTNKVLIAIAHDSIEDTNKTFEWLNEDYGYHVALAIQAISKDKWQDYTDKNIDNEEEKEKDAKEKRNKKYFSHLKSFKAMSKHINSIAKNKWIKLTKKELEEITRNALDVKFADRIHNLSTQWDPTDLEQVRKKVEETKIYFLEISKETNIESYHIIKALILNLEIQIFNTQWKVEKVVKK